MLEPEEVDPTVERIALALRRPVDLGPDVDRAVMSAIRAAPLMVAPGASPRTAVRRSPGQSAWSWLVRPRSLRLAVSPIGALAAAGIAIAAVFGVRREVSRRTDEFRAPIGHTGEFPAVAQAAARDTVVITRFVFVAPSAKEVALVGDFNNWDHGRAPLTKVTDGSGMWSIDVPLKPGRYEYLFLIDGKTWTPDPVAPPSARDDFGRPNSVVTVREAMST